MRRLNIKMLTVLLICLTMAAPYTSKKYVPPQSIGGGMQSAGGWVTVVNQYHPPQSVGGGMHSVGGWSSTPVPSPSPVIQTIIDVAAFMAAAPRD